ncbi:MAG TPA: IS110 family transposase [Vicinamibacterales bacterium]|nr:IS110 family transposase [Vicinamibacterales bacterium]
MRYAGIDIGSERHVVALVDECAEVLTPSSGFLEDADGYAQLLARLGDPADVLVAMEATGHYWQNLFAVLSGRGFAVALLNPLSTRRFAQAGLERAKTDAIDALSIAKLAALKRPRPSRLPDEATRELREHVRLRDRLQQDLGDRVRELHRVVDLAFPEFTRLLTDLGSLTAITVLSAFPTAKSLAITSVRSVAQLVYDGRHKVGEELARALIAAAKSSIGQHQGHVYAREVKYFCADIKVLRERLKEIDDDLRQAVDGHELATLLTTIEGIGPNTAARLVAELGDPSDWRSAGALASHVGVVPQLRHSGKHAPVRSGISPLGNHRLRQALWMPVLGAVRRNPWLRHHYRRLRANGKLAKVALIACMRKLLEAIYSVAKHRRAFEPRVPIASSPA